jgi:hypothetical protein
MGCGHRNRQRRPRPDAMTPWGRMASIPVWLWADDPPEVWATAQRLVAEGYATVKCCACSPQWLPARCSRSCATNSATTSNESDRPSPTCPPRCEQRRADLPAEVRAASCRPAGRTASEPRRAPGGRTPAPQVANTEGCNASTLNRRSGRLWRPGIPASGETARSGSEP